MALDQTTTVVSGSSTALDSAPSTPGMKSCPTEVSGSFGIDFSEAGFHSSFQFLKVSSSELGVGVLGEYSAVTGW